MEVTIAILLPLVLAVVGFFYWLFQDSKNQHLERHIKATRYRPDSNGNYDCYYDPVLDRLVAHDPGNPGYPITYSILATPGDPANRQLLSNYRRPMKINIYSDPANPEPLAEPENEPELLTSSNQFDPAIELLKLKDRGLSKNAAFKQLGINKGSSQLYRELSQLWNGE